MPIFKERGKIHLQGVLVLSARLVLFVIFGVTAVILLLSKVYSLMLLGVIPYMEHLIQFSQEAILYISL